MSSTPVRRLLGCATVLMLSMVTLTGQPPGGVSPPAQPVAFPGADDVDPPPTAARSIEAVAARLAPYIDPEDELWRPFPPDGPSAADLNWDAHPQISRRLISEANVDIEVSVWLFPDPDTAVGYRESAIDVLSTRNEGNWTLGGSYGDVEYESQPFSKVGWEGGRVIGVGEEGRVTNETTSFLRHDVVVTRGILLVHMKWSTQSALMEDPEAIPQTRDAEADAAARALLSLLGGDPASAAPVEPDETALSNQVSASAPQLDYYHPDAAIKYWSRDVDLLCSGVDWLEKSLWHTGWSRSTTVRPSDVGDPDRLTEQSASDAIDAVSVYEVYQLEADSDAARRQAEEWVGLEAAVVEHADPWPPDEPCSSWWQFDGEPVGGEYEVESIPVSNRAVTVDGWNGHIESMAARYVSADADDPAEVAVQVRAAFWHGNLAVYLRYQVGGGDDLDGALADAVNVVIKAARSMAAG